MDEFEKQKLCPRIFSMESNLSPDDHEVVNKLINNSQQVEVKYIWDEDFQRVVIGMLLCDRYFLNQSLGLVKHSYFVNEVHQMVSRILFDYFEEYRHLPSKIYMRQAVTDRLRNKYKNQDNDTFQAVRLLYLGELNTIYDYYGQGGVGDMMPALDSPEAILDRIEAFAKTQAMKFAFFQSLELIRKNPEADETWVKVDEILKEARMVERQTDLGLDYFGQIEERYTRMANAEETAEVFSSGFDTIDRSLHGGGLMRGEIGAWMGKPGCGKTWIKDTLILMYDGTTKKVQDIVIGDLVMGDDSTPRKVLNTHRLIDKVYEIKPIKGDSYFVNAKHILSLKNSHRQGGWRKDRMRRNKSIPFEYHSARVGKSNIYNISVEDWLKQVDRFKIKMKGWRTGVEWSDRPVKIDPYILGLWLGDGTSGLPELTNTDDLLVEVWHEEGRKRGLFVRKTGKIRYRMEALEGLVLKEENSFYRDLVSYNLVRNKHIPHDYKVNSRQKRLQLLAGLLDTDGHKSGNEFEITQKSKVLADDIVFLARSLGFAAYMKECRKRCQTGVGTYYRISIFGNCIEIPVKLEYKKCSQRRQIKNHLFTGINVIEHDRYDEFYGFEVDGNHLLLLADFTVVHNSLSLVTGAVKNLARGKKVLYISTEMDQDRIATRFDAQISLIGQHQLMLKKEEVWTALRQEVNDYEDKRRLVIKQFPSGTADVNTIQAYHSQLSMYGFRPDLVIVDYLGDLKDAPGIPTWESKFRMMRDLRGFGKVENHCTFTAVQPNRGATDLGLEEFMDESKQGGSFMQNQALDCFWTLNQTSGEQKAGLGRIFVAKARNGRSRFFFNISYNYDSQTLNLQEVSDDFYRSKLSSVKDSQSEEVKIDQVVTGGTKRNWKPSDGERVGDS
jgi:replicative DNA helicase